MAMSVRQIKEFIKWAKKEGITSIEITPEGTVKVQFSQETILNLPQPEHSVPTNSEDTKEEYTEEDTLFWSS